jgi:quercetin dioxygenase-like cupin family protein
MRDDAPRFVRHDLFGGRGAVTVTDLLGATSIAPFVAVLGCELEPGGSVGRHVQEAYPEIVIGLGGQGTATVNETEHRLSAGDVVPLPLGAVLAIDNPGDEPLRYLIVKAAV